MMIFQRVESARPPSAVLISRALGGRRLSTLWKIIVFPGERGFLFSEKSGVAKDGKVANSGDLPPPHFLVLRKIFEKNPRFLKFIEE